MDQETRDERIVSLMPLVRSMARAMKRKMPQFEYDDLVSEGMLGAIQAVDRWDPAGGGSLDTFARHRVIGQMIDYTRDFSPLSRAHWKLVKEGELEFHLGSLDTPIVTGAGSTVDLVDILPDNEDTIAKMIDMLTIRDVIMKLPPKDQEVLRYYYYDGMTLRQIANLYGVSESRICQRLARMHRRAYEYLEEEAA